MRDITPLQTSQSLLLVRWVQSACHTLVSEDCRTRRCPLWCQAALLSLCTELLPHRPAAFHPDGEFLRPQPARLPAWTLSPESRPCLLPVPTRTRACRLSAGSAAEPHAGVPRGARRVPPLSPHFTASLRVRVRKSDTRAHTHGNATQAGTLFHSIRLPERPGQYPAQVKYPSGAMELDFCTADSAS